MTVSSQLSSVIAGSVSHSPLVKTSSTPATGTTGDAFGAAVNLDLSPAAQATVSAQGSDSQSNSGNSSDAPPPPAPSGGGAPASSTSSTSQELADAITSSKRKVAAQVGVVEAEQLVDSQGNIDRIGLAKVVAKQQLEASAQTTT